MPADVQWDAKTGHETKQACSREASRPVTGLAKLSTRWLNGGDAAENRADEAPPGEHQRRQFGNRPQTEVVQHNALPIGRSADALVIATDTLSEAPAVTPLTYDPADAAVALW